MHPTQRAILERLAQDRLPPTLRELAAHLGMSVGGTRHHVETLRGDGFLAWEPRLARTMRITAPGLRALGAARQPEEESTHE